MSDSLKIQKAADDLTKYISKHNSAKIPVNKDNPLKPLIDRLNALFLDKDQSLEEMSRKLDKSAEDINDLKTEREQFRESISEMFSLQKISEIIASSRNISEVLASLKKLSGTLVNVIGCGVFLFTKNNKRLEPILLDDLTEENKQNIFLQLEDGILDWVIKERRPTLIPDIQNVNENMSQQGEMNFIIIPLIVRDRGIGIFAIYSDVSRDAITFQDLEFLSLLANQAAVAIENSKLYTEMDNRIKELSLLFNISNQIDSSLNINIFFQNIARITCRELGIKSCLFYLKDNNSFFFRGGYGFSDDFNPDILPGKLASFPRAAQSLEPQFSPRHTSSPQAKIIKDLNLTKILCVPLVAKDNLHGIMVIGTSAKNPDGIINNKDLILTIANHATGWIERSKLFEELKQTNRSLTETRDQLIQSSKLAAIGQLAGGVAHEINNPLQIILVKAQLSMRKIKKLNLDLKELQAIESETKRIAQIVKGLLDFSRQSSETRDFSLVDIPRVLQECIDLIRHQMEMQSIHIQSNIPADIPLVRGNANQLKQVFLNLCLNAQHAMEKGGLFSIALRITDKAVLIDFTDTGCGIKKEYLEKIFEPFFTTKPPGTGTGLGLSVSYGVIEKHGGRINVKSEMNKGSTFTVELPANGADEESAG